MTHLSMDSRKLSRANSIMENLPSLTMVPWLVSLRSSGPGAPSCRWWRAMRQEFHEPKSDAPNCPLQVPLTLWSALIMVLWIHWQYYFHKTTLNHLKEFSEPYYSSHWHSQFYIHGTILPKIIFKEQCWLVVFMVNALPLPTPFFACVHAWMHACMCACMCACVCVCV